MIFHKNISKDPSINNQDISKYGINNNNINVLNKMYIYPEKKDEKFVYKNDFLKNTSNIMNINNKNNINNNNFNNYNYNNINSFIGQNNKVEIIHSQKNNQKIDEIIRNRFVRKVYGILLVLFIFTFSLVLICQIKAIKNFLYQNVKLYISLMIISGVIFIVSFIIFICVPSFLRKFPQNYIFLFLFTISETILLIYVSILYSFHCVLASIIFIIGICVVIFIVSSMNKISLKFICLCLIIAINQGIIYGILALIFQSYYFEFLFCLIGAIIFTFILVYDTQTITKVNENCNYMSLDDYIYAVLILYTDIIRIFIHIIRMMGIFSFGSGAVKD